MDPATIAAIIAGAGSIGSGIMGGMQADAASQQAQEARRKAVEQWLSIHVPNPADQAVMLQKFQSAGELHPELQKLIQQGPSELKNLQIDPTSRAAEIQALTQMQSIANQGGMDAIAKQQEAEALNQSNANEKGQRDAIVQSFAQKGLGGSGAQLAAQLMAQQGAANRSASAGLQAASGAQERGLQALMNSGNMAGNINAQDYRQAASAAEAQDAINRWNAMNAQGVEGSNVGMKNQAQASNLANNQDILNKNTNVANTQEQYNKGLLQNNFNNQATIAQGVGNAYTGQAAGQQAAGQQKANMWGDISGALATAGGALYKDGQKKSSGEEE